MKIDDPGKEQFPVQTFELTDISHPTLIRTLRCEVAFQQIRSVCGVRPATPPTFAAVRPDKSGVGHQAGGAADADQLAKPLHLEQVTIVINKPAATHLVVSFAKYTAARFKIS